MDTLFVFAIMVTSFFAAFYSTRWLSKGWHVWVAFFVYFTLQVLIFE